MCLVTKTTGMLKACVQYNTPFFFRVSVCVSVTSRILVGMNYIRQGCLRV